MVEASVSRCVDGRLATAYPAARHDVELRVSGIAGEDLAAVLARESTRVLAGDPRCRKVVYAAPAGDLAHLAAAEQAGFRYVVDVDVPGEAGMIVAVSLLVREPEFVTRVDMDLDRVPHS